MQFAADNVDHNICTLDGSGTFHGMGIITMVTPGINVSKPVPRVSISSEDIVDIGRIKIYQWDSKQSISHLKYTYAREHQLVEK